MDILYRVYCHYIKAQDCNLVKQSDYTFTLSKGHAAYVLYSVLHKYGYLASTVFETYLQYLSILGSYQNSTKVLGAEASKGSLGHGLPFTVG